MPATPQKARAPQSMPVLRSLRDQSSSVEACEEGAGDDGVAVRGVVAVVIEEPFVLRLPVGAEGRQDVQVGDTAPGAELAAAILRIVVLVAAEHLDVDGEERDRERSAFLAGLLIQGGHDAVQDLPGPGVPSEAEVHVGVVDLEVKAVFGAEHVAALQGAARAEALPPLRVDLDAPLTEKRLAHDLNAVRRPRQEAAPRERRRN